MSGFETLNAQLASQLDQHHTIGHAFFKAPQMTPRSLTAVWERKIFPLIEPMRACLVDVVLLDRPRDDPASGASLVIRPESVPALVTIGSPPRAGAGAPRNLEARELPICGCFW